MGDAIRYPNMGTVKKAAEIYGLSPCYILAQYFEQGDPGPAGQDEAANDVRRVVR